MPARRYQLLCPISRALDHIGDRWTLLILRDLHAGPVRHRDLAAGLTGIPSNLLATRLRELQASGLIEKIRGLHGVKLYALTESGRATGPVLFALARLGTHFPPDPQPRRPGNLRLVAVTLQEALARVVTANDACTIELRIDDEPLTVTLAQGAVQVRYQSADHPDAVIGTDYEPLVAVGDGRLDMQTFALNHVRIPSGDPAIAQHFLGLLAAALS